MHLDLLLGPQAYARRRHDLDRAAVDLYETTTRSASGRMLARVHDREWARLSPAQRDLVLELFVARALDGSAPPPRATPPAPPARPPRRTHRRTSDGSTLAALAASAFGPFAVIALPWGFLALPDPHGTDGRADRPARRPPRPGD